MRTLNPRPTDADIDENVAELLRTTTLLGRALGDQGPAETLESDPTPDQIASALVGAYCEGDDIYMPGAEPGIPAEWRALRAHSFTRDARGNMVYLCREYLPVLSRFAGFGPIADPDLYEGILTAKFAELGAGLKRLGKPRVRQKQKLEFEWGGPNGTPGFGALYIKLERGKELAIGGGDSAPWRSVELTISLVGAPHA